MQPRAASDLTGVLDRLAHAEAELDRLRAELAHAQRLATLGSLAAGTAHEINNLLSPALALAQLAQLHPDDAALASRALARAGRSIQDATEIARTILGFASPNSPERGAGDDESHGASIEAALHAALRCLGRDPAKDGIELHIDLGETPHQPVDISPIELQQILLNLLLNAIAAVGRSPVKRIMFHVEHSQDRTTKITVRDTGPGVPNHRKPLLFKPFTANSPDGHGLGLTVCRMLAERAGGSINLDDSHSPGAALKLILPNKIRINKTARLVA
ncbi:MAG TPA: ATP-binding protein [Phycisphaerales bacterium]|nr:ATP-binding protein [Phycisphaerales bacterium]HRQ75822.1 ATP-binding protein [Phycisphaerales bacterium]